MLNIFTVDIEGWYQSSLEILREGKHDYQRIVYPNEEVPRQTQQLLNILREYNTKATFFILGTVAEKFPNLIAEIKAEGHEIGTHGYSHNLVYRQKPQEFILDIRKSLKLLVDITGEPVLSHRAPYFSITQDSYWALRVLVDEGICFDSSIFPIKRKLYGMPNSPRIPYRVGGTGSPGLMEFPLTTVKLPHSNINLPIAGGGYFRLLPYWIIKAGIAKINREGVPAVFYIHPYELDSDELKNPIYNQSLTQRRVTFLQNIGRKRVEMKLRNLLTDFKFAPLEEVANDI